jgi:hypothetical protein
VTTPSWQKVIGPFTQNAPVDANGIRPAIANLQQTLTDMIQAYNKATNNNAQTEELARQHMGQQKNALAEPWPDGTALRGRA